MKKLFSNIIIDLILFDLLFGITCLIIDKFGLEYLKWVNQTILIVNCIGGILGILQLIMKIKSKPERIIMIILVIVNLLIFNKIIIGVIAFIHYLSPPEYIVEIENKKMVGYVVNGYETRVDYYKYKNIFTREKNRTYEENYGKGSFNPFEEEHSILTYYYYNEEGELEKRIDTIEESEDLEESNQRENSESAILYEKKINEDISIRVRRECFILAQRCVITIQKTIDGGSTWNKESNGIIINNSAEFTFIDENVGFINDHGLAGTNGENGGLLVTNNGGKTFIKANIELENSKKDAELYIDNVPYQEENVLKVKVCIIEKSEEKYYYFYSKDNGLNWKIESEK